MKQSTSNTIKLNGRQINYRIVRSNTARKLRVRIGINGVEVIQPNGRVFEDLKVFFDYQSELDI